MGAVEITVIAVLAIGALFSDEIMKGLGGMGKDKDEVVVVPEPAPQPAPVPAPQPQPVDGSHDTTIVGIVAGWNCFKSQCEAAGLDDVVSNLDEIFPMLIQVDKDTK